MNVKKDERFYRYLYQLQRSGITNMMGAAPYLQSHFGLDKNTAREILQTWMNKYEEIAKELNIEI